MKKIYVLVGPPSVGKSTWIKNNFPDANPYIISRDEIAESQAEEMGLTYDEMFMTPPDGSKVGEESQKYGKVIESPKGVRTPLSYDKILDANSKINNKLASRISEAKGQDIIIVDMTNMSKWARKNALNAIKGVESEYEKIAVVFNFKGGEDIIKKVAAKRAEEAKNMGKSKTIPESAFETMFRNWEEVSKDEVFDKIIHEDTIDKLRQSISESKILKYAQFKSGN